MIENQPVQTICQLSHLSNNIQITIQVAQRQHLCRELSCTCMYDDLPQRKFSHTVQCFGA